MNFIRIKNVAEHIYYHSKCLFPKRKNIPPPWCQGNGDPEGSAIHRKVRNIKIGHHLYHL
jgi:hypothetical protein